jgi:hypothetical protein
MRREPEWVSMYFDLVSCHCASAERRYQHGVRLADCVVDDDHIDWCLANLGMDSWTWEDQHIMGVSFAVFTFVNEEDMVMFKLTWA